MFVRYANRIYTIREIVHRQFMLFKEKLTKNPKLDHKKSYFKR